MTHQRTDTERLDWLERNEVSPINHTLQAIELFYYDQSWTLRQAIDAAIDREAAGGEE